MPEYDPEFINRVHGELDLCVEHVVDRMMEQGLKAGLSEEELKRDYISPNEVLHVKHVIKELIPFRPPTTAFMIMTLLQGIMSWAEHMTLLHLMNEDPDRLKEFVSMIEDNQSTLNVIEQLKDKHEEVGSKYTETELNGVVMRTCDLGDVTSDISFN